VVQGNGLPTVFPSSLRERIDSALLICDATSTGGNYLAVSAHRIDEKAQAIDIEPFGIIVHSTGSGSAGVFVHHGDWEERTQSLPLEFSGTLAHGSIGESFLATQLHGLREGTLEQLPKAHRGAFDALIREIRAREDKALE
jgi:hypothetical protein